MGSIRRRRRTSRVAAAGLGDGFFQHLLVELDADLADLSGLFLAQQVAGAADVEIVAGERKAGAESESSDCITSSRFCAAGVILRRGGKVR